MAEEEGGFSSAAEADTALLSPLEPETSKVDAPETAPAGTEGAETVDRPRDVQGRFEKAEAPPGEVDPPAETADVTPPETEAPPTEPAAAESVEAEPLPPLTYKADGREYEIPGSEVRTDGVFIPNDALPQVQRTLSDGQTIHGSFSRIQQDWARQVREAQAEATAVKEQAQALGAGLEVLMTDPEKLQAWLDDPKNSFDALKQAADHAAGQSREQSAIAELARRDQQEQLRATENDRSEAVSAEIWSVGQAEGLTEDEVKVLGPEVWRTLWDMPNLWRFATKEEAAASGGRATEGQLSMDVDMVRTEMRRAARAVVLMRSKREQVETKRGEAAKRNAEKPAAKPTNQVPPVAPTTGTTVPAQKETAPQPQTREEADAWFKRTAADDMV